jgi:cytochrome c biogenesis protein CcdA
VSNPEPQKSTNEANARSVPGCEDSSNQHFKKSVNSALLYGAASVVLAFTAAWILQYWDLLAIMVGLGISILGILWNWIRVFLAFVERPKKPGKVAGAATGAALAMGIWVLVFWTFCGGPFR